MKNILGWLDRFPKTTDFHKLDKRKVPTCFGIFYALISVAYLYILHYFSYYGALALASCLLFGAFLGLIDDVLDVPRGIKALLPLVASLPLIVLRQGNTSMSTYFFGRIDFGIVYYLLVIPLITTVTANSVNMLSGLNGVTSLCPLIIMLGFMIVSKDYSLLLIPTLVLLILAFYNVQGKIFLGNVGSFSTGIVLSSFSIIANMEQMLLISIMPYILNSTMIVYNRYLRHRKAKLILLDDGRLTAIHKRSLVTFIAKVGGKVSESVIVLLIVMMFAYFVGLGIVLTWIM